MEDDSQLQECGITNAVAKAQLPAEVGLAFRYEGFMPAAHVDMIMNMVEFYIQFAFNSKRRDKDVMYHCTLCVQLQICMD